MATIHLLIKGKVQGVFYRASAKEKAEELALTGWIKNTDNGDVEALVSGNADSLESFIDWCKKGPEKAMVTNVDVNPSEDQSFERFSIIRR